MSSSGRGEHVAVQVRDYGEANDGHSPFQIFLRKLYLQNQRLLRAFIATVFNSHVLLVSAVALGSVYLTEHVFNQVYRDGKLDIAASGIKYKVDMTFISVGAVFPLIFSIQAAFSRREAAARTMASMKAQCLSLYMLHRDWNRVPDGDMSGVGDNNTPHAQEARHLLYIFLKAVRAFLMDNDHGCESYAEVRFQNASFKDTWVSMFLKASVSFKQSDAKTLYKDKNLRRCYDALNRLSVLNEKTLVRWGYAKSGEAPTSSRVSAALTAIIENFEMLRNVRDYRTPVMLRYGNRVLVLIMVVFLGPYFNTFCYDQALKNRLPGCETNCNVNFIVAELFVIVVTLLNQIAKDIEYPFDMQGMDDLFFEVASELHEFAHLQVPHHDDLLCNDSLVQAHAHEGLFESTTQGDKGKERLLLEKTPSDKYFSAQAIHDL